MRWRVQICAHLETGAARATWGVEAGRVEAEAVEAEGVEAEGVEAEGVEAEGVEAGRVEAGVTKGNGGGGMKCSTDEGAVS